MDDIQLAKAISTGDQVAFKLFFERYYNPLLAYISTFTHQSLQAEDITQQAFVTLWDNREKIKPEHSLKNYLYTIAYNGYIDQYRKSKYQNSILDHLKRRALADRLNERDDTADQRIEKLRSIVDALPYRCQEILKLNKIQGLKYREIAEMLDISVKTVESQMRIAYQKIREEFQNPQE